MIADIVTITSNVIRSAFVAATAIGAATFVAVLLGGAVKEFIDLAKVGWWR